MARKTGIDDKEEEVVMTEEDMREIDALLLEDAKKYFWIIGSAILTAIIIQQLLGYIH